MELRDLKGLVVTILIIGLVLGMGFLLIREFADTMGDNAYTVTNETFDRNFVISETGMDVSRNKSSWNCFNDFAVTHVYNGTGTTDLILPANYSYDTAGRVWNITPLPPALCADWDSAPAGTGFNISYTFKYSNSTACEGMEETVGAAEEIQEWLGILVIMFIVGILLFIVYQFAFPAMPGGRMPRAGRGSRGRLFGGGGGDSGSAEI